MHVAVSTRRYKEKVYRSVLLRRSVRDGEKVRKETLANLSHLPDEAVEAIRQVLAGKELVVAGSDFDVQRSRLHGHVAAVSAMAEKLGFPKLLGPPCRERDLVFGLIVGRVCCPGSKLATTRWWTDTTLAADLGIEDASTDDVYAAMDWLGERQDRIESELLARHVEPASMVLYDLSSSWVYGRTSSLAQFGYSRDGKRGEPQINYGLVCTPGGCPVAVNVFSGNTSDPAAFAETVTKLRDHHHLSKIVLVGDRGMITAARIADLKSHDGIGWITALRAPTIQKLARQGVIQLSLFDEMNLAELTSDDFAGERLIACRNPAVAAERARKRAELLTATDTELDKVTAAVNEGRLKDPGKIGVRVGRILNRFKMSKHYQLTITDSSFAYTHDTVSINTEAVLDGIYIIRAGGQPTSGLDPAGVVGAYKQLANVEREFRTLKTVDLELRPIHHHLDDRIKTHIFICMLAAYLVWHLRRAWAPLCFTDQQPPERHDPVSPTRRSTEAQQKASTRTLPNGQAVHSFQTLLNHLATLTRDTIRFNTGTTIEKTSEPTPTQRQAFNLLNTTIPTHITH